MKNFFKLFGIITLVAVIGFSMIACDNGGGGGSKTTTPPPDSIVGTWKGSATVPRAVFTETNWMLYMTGTQGRDEDTQGDTYTYNNGTATLTPNSWSSGGTATVSGNSMTIVIQWTPPSSFGPLTKQ